MPRTDEQNQMIRETRRQDILDAALKLFAENGFHNTSISMIARRVKISKGLIYNYFESKDEILDTVVSSGIDELMDYFPEKLESKNDFARMITQMTDDLKHSKKEHWRLYFAVMMQANVVERFQDKIMAAAEPLFTEMIKYFTQRGYNDPYTHAMFVGAALDGITMNYIANNEFPLDACKQKLIDEML